MNITITGGSGFIGSELIKSLLKYFPNIEKIISIDVSPLSEDLIDDHRLTSIVGDITNENTINEIINERTTHVFHLAAIVSSHAEEDFDLGMSINVKSTQLLLERCRDVNSNIRFIFASSLAVFGGKLPNVIDYMTAMQPSSSYGTQKAICELLINDYARKRFVDAISVRLPTICIRPGAPNKAASSFVSGIIREPLKHQSSNCPVDITLPLWISSPKTVIDNIIHASTLDSSAINDFKTINLPGLQTTPKEMIQSLLNKCGKDYSKYISENKDETINKIVSSWPKEIKNDHELSLGFKRDNCFDDILEIYLKNYS